MKSVILSLQFILIFLMTGCKKDENNNTSTSIGSGVEFYLTKNSNFNNYNIDYSHIDLDTIAIIDTPFIKYSNISSYDTLTSYLILKTPISSELFHKSARGNMFIVTLNTNKIYCGFLWPVYSSAMPSWIFIHEPIDEPILDTLKLDRLYDSNIDPRKDVRIIDRLKKDNKLK